MIFFILMSIYGLILGYVIAKYRGLSDFSKIYDKEKMDTEYKKFMALCALSGLIIGSVSFLITQLNGI